MNKLILLSLLVLGSCYVKPPSHSEIARQHLKKKEYSEAIKSYELHIQSRLKAKSKAEWENPYLYYLDIGDIYLSQDNIDLAMKYYLMAEDKEVTPALISDRFRQVALWYEAHQQYELALQHLVKYQDRDPDLFNMVLDRIAKTIAAEEAKN